MTVPAGPGHIVYRPRLFLGLRLSPLMVYPQHSRQSIPIVAFYDMQENTAVQFYSPRNHGNRSGESAKMHPINFIESRYLHSNGIIANAFLLGRDLNRQGRQFEMIISLGNDENDRK